jgi:hypothetical protein
MAPDQKLFGKKEFRILFLANDDPRQFEDFFEQFKNSTNLRFTMTNPREFGFSGKRKERFDAVFLYAIRGSYEDFSEMILEEESRAFLSAYLCAPVNVLGIGPRAVSGYKDLGLLPWLGNKIKKTVIPPPPDYDRYKSQWEEIFESMKDMWADHYQNTL